ncbi:putative suppressor of forked, tetratricopeptide-like helical domain-containing protein [Rosa chinensis]|uniref:Putative suppressor of forked, tetratricopeptide-like helical domain-containing protein n=1 Tax=Rosa chinensis TaxID=74649 RepID=A0A2P6QH43_ROSCH|nr:pre-mRNA-splicing factor CLF1 [Rosa chinensis]XP_024158549.1 pre-mRNA-splicing factor CLF1 [Rosa chinensis]PRQ33481.1 putative suppressor of forked, tetratricopeptide-like helical domain-containing protein [Rosa chinensis]
MVYDEIVAVERRNRDWRRVHYEQEVRNNPLNYDSWLAYIGLEESAAANKHRIRELFRRATANVPPVPELYRDGKLRWRRYVDLWIYYATYEEGSGGDARQVYEQCLAVIPHDKFSFAKVWLLAAGLELRQGNLKGARKILATAMRTAPKPKIFIKCIEMEMKLGNLNQCRKLYEKYVCWKPQNWDGWVKYAEFERALGETERVRALFELGIQQPETDLRERLWSAYIEFEISEGEFERTRKLYERLLDCSKDVRVWISYARFEAQENHSIEHATMVFSRAARYLKAWGRSQEERNMLGQVWLDMEASFGDLGLKSWIKMFKIEEKSYSISRLWPPDRVVN